MGGTFAIVGETFREFYRDEGLGMSAALAFYAIFALPSLLIIVITIAGLIVDPIVIGQQIRRFTRELTNPEVARHVWTLFQQVPQQPFAWNWTTVVGVGTLIFAATVAFARLQTTMNKIWEARPKPDRNVVTHFLFKRAVSFAMVVALALFLLVSVAFSTVLAVLPDVFTEVLPAALTRPVVLVMDGLISFAVICGLTAVMFKVLPNTKITWRDAFAGALVVALLFMVGQYVVGLYLSQSRVTTMYQAAGSIAVILVWFYYSSISLCLGGEFAQVYARHAGREIEPGEGFVRADEPRHASHRESSPERRQSG